MFTNFPALRLKQKFAFFRKSAKQEKKNQREFDNSSEHVLNSVGVETIDFENSKKAFIDVTEKIDRLSRDCSLYKFENRNLNPEENS